MKLPKDLQYALDFARFCALHDLTPSAGATIVQLARKAFTDGVRDANAGTTRQEVSGKAFEAEALTNGFGVTWSGLSPTLTRDGRDIYVPLN